MQDAPVRRPPVWLAGLTAGVLLVSSMSSTAGGAVQGRLAAPGHPDPGCDGGRGLQLHVPDFTDGGLTSVVTLRTGVVVVAISPPSNPPSGLELYAVDPDCTLDTGFGDHGERTLSPIGGVDGSLDTVIAAVNGDLLVFGDTPGKLIATELSPTGAIVRGFGHNGWSVASLPGWGEGLTPGPDVDAVAQAPNGMILLGGDDGEPHCCVHSLMYELTASGHLVRSFGHGGVAAVFGQGAYIDQVLPLPGGSTLVVAQVIYGGCGGLHYAVLNLRGRLEPAITTNLTRTESSLPRSQWADAIAYATPGRRIGLIGVGAPRCYGPSRPFAYNEQLSRVGRLRPGGDRHFFTPIHEEDVQAVAAPDGHVYFGAVDDDWSTLVLRSFQPDGAVDDAFGRGGVVSMGLNQAVNIPLAVLAVGPGHDLDVVLPELEGPKVLEVVG